MGKIFVFCRIKLKFRFWLYKKCWRTSWKFQLEIRSNKKVISKKPLTNLYEMNSSFLPTSGKFWRPVMTYAHNLDQEKAPTNMGPHLKFQLIDNSDYMPYSQKVLGLERQSFSNFKGKQNIIILLLFYFTACKNVGLYVLYQKCQSCFSARAGHLKLSCSSRN